MRKCKAANGFMSIWGFRIAFRTYSAISCARTHPLPPHTFALWKNYKFQTEQKKNEKTFLHILSCDFVLSLKLNGSSAFLGAIDDAIVQLGRNCTQNSMLCPSDEFAPGQEINKSN